MVFGDKVSGFWLLARAMRCVDGRILNKTLSVGVSGYENENYEEVEAQPWVQSVEPQ